MEVVDSDMLDFPDEHSVCTSDPAGKIYDSYVYACPNGTTVPIPMPLDVAVNACNCPNDDCSIMWSFK